LLEKVFTIYCELNSWESFFQYFFVYFLNHLLNYQLHGTATFDPWTRCKKSLFYCLLQISTILVFLSNSLPHCLLKLIERSSFLLLSQLRIHVYCLFDIKLSTFMFLFLLNLSAVNCIDTNGNLKKHWM
jgi:hypothetical protein